MALRSRSGVVLSVVVGAVVCAAISLGRSAPMQAAPAQAPSRQGTPADSYQRSADHFVFKASAKSGPQRGEELYFYKCWYCHNRFAKRAPYLEDLFKRPNVTDQTVAGKIRQGGPGMPSYGSTLTDADIADVISYLKERCCWEGENPPPNPRYRVGAASAGRPMPTGSAVASRRAVLGGARGTVHNTKGDPLDGVGVQLISQKTAIRTTVYTNEEGRYEFPVLESGAYTLRIPRPLEFKPYVKESVRIDGAAQLDDIQLDRVSTTEFLPPTPEILAQLTGVEWMMNLPGTGEEKRVFTLGCGFGCHSYQQVFRNRYDERSWKLIFQRMLRSGASTLIPDVEPTPTTIDRAGRSMLEDEAFLARWLASVRGPDAKPDPPLHYLPRERGRSTRVVVTEYELPRELLAPHDVHGDANGNIWYSAHRSAYSGVLDPRTGNVKQYRIPEKEKAVDALPGTHRVWVDKQGLVWYWETWGIHLNAFDPRTEQVVRRFDRRHADPVTGGSLGGANFAMDVAGYVYQTNRGAVIKTDSRTGEVVQRFPLKKIQSTYDSMITPDGRYWAGGTTTSNIVGLLDTKTGESWEVETPTLQSNPARGGFDPQGNAWIGGRGGALIKMDGKTHRVTEHFPPIPYETFYEAMPDKNGEVWAGGLQSGRFWRFNPTANRWTAYMMPEPYAHDRRTWIDNSTDPVTVWYVDHNGYMVRIQPLD